MAGAHGRPHRQGRREARRREYPALRPCRGCRFEEGIRSCRGKRQGPGHGAVQAAEARPGKPDFTSIEGEGKAYGQQQGGVGDLIEYDHVIDKSYPLAAKSLAVGDDTVAVPADGMSKRQIAKAQGRKNLLAQTPLFPEGSAMSKYTGYGGFSIGVYRPVHLAVTRAVKANSSEPIRKARRRRQGAGDFRARRKAFRSSGDARADPRRAAP